MYTCNKECKSSTSHLCINQIIKYQGNTYIVWVIKSYSHTTPLYNFNTAHQLRLPAHQAVKRRQVGFKWRLLHIPLKLGERTPLGGPFPSPRPPCYPSYLTYFYISGVSGGELFRKFGIHSKNYRHCLSMGILLMFSSFLVLFYFSGKCFVFGHF